MTDPTRGEPHDLVAGYLLDALDEPELQGFLTHLPSCPQCRDEVAVLASIAADLGSMAEHQPPASVEADLMHALFGPAPPGAPSAQGASAERPEPRVGAWPTRARQAPAASGPGPAETVPRRHARGRRWAWPVSVAAAFLLGMVVTASVLGRAADPSAHAQMHQIMQISASQDAHVMPMEVPSGEATMVVSDAMDQAAIVATDLPMPSERDEYVLWSVMADGSMRSAATFRPDRQGRAAEVIETGVRDAEAFMLTVEAPGTSHPTGPPLGEVRT